MVFFHLLLHGFVALQMLPDPFFPCLVKQGNLLFVSLVCLLDVLFVSDLQLLMLKLQLFLFQLGNPQLRSLGLKEVPPLQAIVLVILKHQAG